MVQNWMQTTLKINGQQISELEGLQTRKDELAKGILKIKSIALNKTKSIKVQKEKIKQILGIIGELNGDSSRKVSLEYIVKWYHCF